MPREGSLVPVPAQFLLLLLLASVWLFSSQHVANFWGVVTCEEVNNSSYFEDHFQDEMEQHELDDTLEQLNVTQILLRKFHHLFDEFNQTDLDCTNYHRKQQQQQQQQTQQNELCASQEFGGSSNLIHTIEMILNATKGSAPSVIQANVSFQMESPPDAEFPLQTRTTSQNGGGGGGESGPQHQAALHSDAGGELLPRRNFFRILNKVFSRVELPESFKPPRSNMARGNGGSDNVGGSPTGGHCAAHIGCVDELPNFPSLLKLKPNVSTLFTVYTRETGHKAGRRILFEPTMHYQLADSSLSEHELQAEALRIKQLAKQQHLQMHPNEHHLHHHQNHLLGGGGGNINAPLPQTNGGGGDGDGGGLNLASAAAIAAAASPGGNQRQKQQLLLLTAAAAAMAQTRQQMLDHQSLHQRHKLLLKNNNSHHHHQLRRASHASLASSLSGLARANEAAAELLLKCRHNGAPPTAAAAAAAAAAVFRRRQTASSWSSPGLKIARSQELPFDLAAIEQCKFNASLTTRIIIGGYFAKEDEEWIDELIKQWLLLEPGNVIKVSWQDSNRGLYHTAAYNSRIVGRQLSLFLHYLNEMFRIDLSQFHLVGHSLGAHIAGFAGADNEGRIARITGLDPAGPIFVDLNSSMRLDASDAKFVDVMHTNGGTITKGALGLSTPSGHVDYYCNGGSMQPGCYFSSVTKSIMDPVERVACNHRRSYRYFTEIIKLAVRARQQREEQMRNHQLTGQQLLPNSWLPAAAIPDFPSAFLFEPRQHEDLTRLVQPELALKRFIVAAPNSHSQSQASSPARRWWSIGDDSLLLEDEELIVAEGDGETTGGAQLDESQADAREAAMASLDAPLSRRIEFHLLRPRFPTRRRGLYFFKTRSEAPFFASKQFALTIRTEQLIRRKIALTAKINSTLIAEVEIDELDGNYSIVFAPNDPNLIDLDRLGQGRAPDLYLMWRQRSFNLLLGQQNELFINSVELSLLDQVYNLNGDGITQAHTLNQQQPPQTTTTSTPLQPQTNPLATSSGTRNLSRDNGQYQQQATGGGGGRQQAPVMMIVRYELSEPNSLLRQTGRNNFVLTRNQWHRFGPRAAV